MIHEIINPSDKYTIECDDMALLTASIFLLGEGLYSTQSKDTDFTVPMTALGGLNGVEFFKKEFDLDLAEYVPTHKKEIAECLETICLGSFKDRKTYFSRIAETTTEEEKEKFISEWYDEKQSSLNPIGQRALAIAKHFNATK